MELTQLKRINNLGNKALPKFADGALSAILKISGYSGYNSGARTLIGGEYTGINNNTPLSAIQLNNVFGGDNGIYNSAVTLSITPNTINYSDDPYTINPKLQPPGLEKDTSIKDKSSNTSGDMSGLSAIPAAAFSTYNSFTKYNTADDFLNSALVQNSSVGGIGYNTLSLDNSDINSLRRGRTGSNILTGAATGASIGSVAGPWGAVIGGVVGGLANGIGSIFSNSAERREQDLANAKINNTNSANRSSALTKSLRLSNAKTYGDSSTQYLYGAKNGKLPGFNIGKPFGKEFTFTGNGYESDKKKNAYISSGEIVVKKNGDWAQVPGMPDKNDSVPAHINKSDMVVPMEDVPYFLSTGDKEGTAARIAARLAESPTMMNNAATDLLFRAKYGKLPKFAEGWWGNAIPAMLGTAQGISQYLQARANKPYRPNTYVNNPYELDALSTLAGLRVNPYPIMQQLRNAETRTNRAIDRSGGLSVAQRGLSRLAALNNTQSNIANSLAAIQQLNNQYKANYAQAALNAGQNARQARMQADQWDLDYYSKAHAAQLNDMQTGLRNILGQEQGYQQNEFKRRQFNDMMGLYRNDLKIRMDELNTLANQSNYDYARWLLLARQNNWKLPA